MCDVFLPGTQAQYTEVLAGRPARLLCVCAQIVPGTYTAHKKKKGTRHCCRHKPPTLLVMGCAHVLITAPVLVHFFLLHARRCGKGMDLPQPSGELSKPCSFNLRRKEQVQPFDKLRGAHETDFEMSPLPVRRAGGAASDPYGTWHRSARHRPRRHEMLERDARRHSDRPVADNDRAREGGGGTIADRALTSTKEGRRPRRAIRSTSPPGTARALGGDFG